MIRRPKLHITGASGAGTTTLGVSLAARLRAAHLDTDAFFWMPTDPPFTTKRDVSDRITMMTAEMASSDGWVVSGSLCGWGDAFIPSFDVVVFLYVPPAVRMSRILAREQIRYGAQIAPGGKMHDGHAAFVEWASGYDDPDFAGRTLASHEAWLAALPCPVIEIRGTPSVDESAAQVLRLLEDGGGMSSFRP